MIKTKRKKNFIRFIYTSIAIKEHQRNCFRKFNLKIGYIITWLSVRYVLIHTICKRIIEIYFGNFCNFKDFNDQCQTVSDKPKADRIYVWIEIAYKSEVMSDIFDENKYKMSAVNF